MKILIICDELPVFNQLKVMLTTSGEDPADILQLDLQQSFKLKMTPEMADIVIFVIMHEYIENFPNSHILKTYSAFFPVLLLVDRETEDFWHWSLKIGAQDYLVKDEFNEWVLFKTIRQAIYKKNIEDQLRESQRSHATLLSNLPGLVYRCINDHNWTMQFVSEGCLDLTGYRSENLINNHDLAYADLILEEERDYVWEEIQKALKEDRHFEIDYRIRTADGKVKYVREKGVDVFTEEGNLTMLEGFIIDVTHTIETQQKLSRSENRFRGLVESIDDIVFRMDLDQTVTGVFGTWIEKMGFKPEDLLGRDTFELFGEEAGKIHYKAYQKALNGEHHSFEWVLNLDKIKRDFQSSLSPLRDENGEVYGLVGVGRDITQLKQTEKALRESQILAQSIADSLSENICVLDTDGNVIAVNTAWKKMNLETKTNIDVGQNYFSANKDILWLDNENSKKVEGGIREVLDGTLEEFQIEYPGHSADEYAWFQLRAFPLINHRAGAVIMHSSISERKRYELEQQAIIAIYAAMRTSLDRNTLIETILIEISRLLDSGSVAIVTYDPQIEKFWVENALGTWLDYLGKKMECSPNSVCKYVMESGISYLIDKENLEAVPFVLEFDFEVKHLICVPMVVSQERLGVIWVGRDRKFTQSDISQLENIAILAAASIRQLNLFEQTLQRLQYLHALRKIDQTILSSLDRKIILDTILGQVLGLSGKGSMAVDFLTYDIGLNRLEYLTGDGFNHVDIEDVWFVPDNKVVPFSFVQRDMVVLKDLSAESEFIIRRGLQIEDFHVYYSFPMIAKGNLVGVLEVFSREWEGLNQEKLDFLSSIADQTSIALNSIEMFENLRSKNLELIISYDTTIEAWSRTLDLKDEETNKHTQRAARMTIDLAREFGFPENELIHLQHGVLLHDIGKIGIPDRILLKPGPLDKEEWAVIREHPLTAYNLLSPIQFLKKALDIPYCHHEKWDGTGYPQGLSGEQIPLAARLFAVIDVWGALLSDRPFRKAWSTEKTVEYIRCESGKHFDPRVVETFLKFLEKNKEDE